MTSIQPFSIRSSSAIDTTSQYEWSGSYSSRRQATIEPEVRPPSASFTFIMG